MNVTQQRSYSEERPAAWFLIGTLVLSLAPVAFGVAWGINEAHTFTVTEIARATGFAPANGFMYSALVPRSSYESFFRVDGDSPEHPRRAGTRLYENRRRLGPPHRPHFYIRDDGFGQFSHWGRTLYFSSSDNSDPRTNGRTYTIITAASLPFALVWIWGALVLVSGALWIDLGRRPGGRRWTIRPAWKVVGAGLLVLFYLVVARYSLDATSGGWLRGRVALSGLWVACLLAAAILAWSSGRALAKVAPGSLRDARARLDELSTQAGRPFARPGWRGRTLRAATLVIPFVVFAVLVRAALPPQFLLASYFSLTPIAFPVAFVLWCCYVRRDWIGTVASLTVTLALFALPLAALWQHFGLHFNAVGGLLPFSDASHYYYDAIRLLDGHPLGWSARRPLYVGTLSTLLGLTRGNLQITLAVFVALNAVATFLLPRELGISHGPAAAVLATIVLFLFYRVEGGCGTVLTENLGFAVGTVAFAVLWRGSRDANVRGIWLGIGLLTIALMARAGTFFVLPALVFAIAWIFRGSGQWLHASLGAVTAVVIAATLTLGVGRLLADPASPQTAFSNFSYSLYGLVVGGKGWGQAVIDHPAAREGAEMYALAFQAFRARPMGLVEGSLKMWRAYLWPKEPYAVFAFVSDGSHSLFFQLICYFLSACGMAIAAWRHRLAPYALLLAATIGHIASIPLVPPIDAGLRVYAATVPMGAILIGVGGAALLGWGSRVMRTARPIPRPTVASVTAETHTPRVAEAFGLALAAFVFVGPLCVFYASRPPSVEDAPCPAGTLPVHVRFSHGSFLRIIGNVPDVDDTRIVVPEIRARDVPRTAGVVEIRNDVNRFIAGHTMMNAYDLKRGRLVWLVASSAILPEPPNVLQICGHDSPDSLSRQYAVFYADTVRREQGGQQLRVP